MQAGERTRVHLRSNFLIEQRPRPIVFLDIPFPHRVQPIALPMPSSRLFRPDNHLLWMGILLSVAVTLYVGTTYLFDADTSSPSTRANIAMGSSVTTPPDASVPVETVDTEKAVSQASQQLRRRRRVSFASSDDDAANPATPREPVAAATSSPIAPTHVFLDIAKQDFLKDPFVGKVVVELYTKDAPRTTHNFAELCRDKKYVNTPFHRIIKDFMIQGGDLVNQDGTGTYSVYGGEGSTFADEAFVHAHDRPGLLSMANSGPNTNGSQFFITTAPAPHLDGKHVVFGRIVEGMEHVHDVEREVTDPNDRPIRRCYIMNCGVTDKPIGSPHTASEPLKNTLQAQSQTPPTAQALQTYNGGRGNDIQISAPTEPVPFQL